MHKLSLLKLFFLGSNLEDTLWFITRTASVVKKEKIKRIYAIVIIMQVLEYTPKHSMYRMPQKVLLDT